MKLSRIKSDHTNELHSVVADCFEDGASDYWSAVDLVEILLLDNCHGYCASSDGVKTKNGYLGFIVIRTIGYEAEILSLAVLPAYRRTGIAQALVDVAMAGPQAREVYKWFLEVRAVNHPAIK